MKATFCRWMRLIMPCLALACLAGCGGADPDGEKKQAREGNRINIYMWSEYIDPEILKDFERETGIKARVDVYEDTETMIAKVQHQGGDRLYDIVVASDHAVPILARFGLIQALDFSLLPNAENVDPQFRNAPYDPENRHGVPYQWGTIGLLYRKDRLADFEPGWSAVFDPERQPERFVLIDSMRDMMAVALKSLGHSVNARDPGQVREAGDRILRAKKSTRCLGFEGSVGGKNKVAGGMADLAIVYSGEALRAMQEDNRLAYAIPREGSVVWVDLMTITARSRNVRAAHQFINYILDAKVGAQLTEFTQFASPNTRALAALPEALRDNPGIYPPPDARETLEYIQDVQEATRLYDEVWRTVKSH